MNKNNKEDLQKNQLVFSNEEIDYLIEKSKQPIDIKLILDKPTIKIDNNKHPALKYDDDEVILDTNCPNCNRTYDEIDYEYQICHICKYNNK